MARKSDWLDQLDLKSLQEGSGDTIIGNIVDNSGQAVIGKNISIITSGGFGNVTQSDREEINEAINQFKAQFEALQQSLTAEVKAVAAYQVAQIEKQLKSEDEKSVSGSLIETAGDWLIDNIPNIGEALLGLFLPNAVGKVVASAGKHTLAWVVKLKKRVKGDHG